MKIILLLSLLAGETLAGEAGKIHLVFKDDAKESFIKEKIFKAEDFKNNIIELDSSTKVGALSIYGGKKYAPTVCYVGDHEEAKRF